MKAKYLGLFSLLLILNIVLLLVFRYVIFKPKISFEIQSESSSTLQLFFVTNTNPDYSEDKSSKIILTGNNDFQKVQFSVSSKADVARFRLHFGTKPALFSVKNMMIHGFITKTSIPNDLFTNVFLPSQNINLYQETNGVISVAVNGSDAFLLSEPETFELYKVQNRSVWNLFTHVSIWIQIVLSLLVVVGCCFFKTHIEKIRVRFIRAVLLLVIFIFLIMLLIITESGYLFGLSVLISVLVFCLFVIKFFHEKKLLVIVVLAAMCFIVFYALFSVLLICFDIFQVKYALVAVLLCALILSCAVKSYKEILAKIDFNIKGEIAVLVMLITFLPFIALKSYYMYTGLDAGIYTEKAIDFMYGSTEAKKTLKESVLDTPGINEGLRFIQKHSPGLYSKIIDNKIEYYEHHALPVWPAVMALSGKVFGRENVYEALTFLYIVSCLLMYFIGEKIAKNKYIKYLCFLLFAFSPLTIYLAKTPLSELFFVTLVILVIFLLISNDRNKKYFAILPLGLLGCIHITFFMYFPVLFAILLYLSIVSKQKQWNIINIAICIIFPLTILFAIHVSSIYTENQIKGLFTRKLTLQYFLIIIFIFSMICALLQFSVHLLKNKIVFYNGIVFFLTKHIHVMLKILTLFLIGYTIYQGYRLGFTDKFLFGGGAWRFRSFTANKGLLSLPHLNIFSITLITSFITLPYVFYKLLHKKIGFSKLQISFAMLMLYSLAIYTIIRPDTTLNPYSSRYFMLTLVPSIIIIFCTFIKKNRFIFFTVIICLFGSLPYNIYLLANAENKGIVRIVDDVITVIPQDSAVLFYDHEFIIYLANNLREINNNEVYTYNNIFEVYEQKKDKGVYLISDIALFHSGFTLVQKKTYNFNQLLSLEAVGSGFLDIFPIKMTKPKISKDIYIYEVKLSKTLQSTKIISFLPPDIEYLHNFHQLETNFAWTKDVSSFYLTLDPKKINRIRVTYNGVPGYIFNAKSEYHIKFKLGDTELYEKIITKDSAGGGIIEFDIPASLVNPEQMQWIDIYSDVWSPKDFGASADSRKLGIPISKIEVVGKN